MGYPVGCTLASIVEVRIVPHHLGQLKTASQSPMTFIWEKIMRLHPFAPFLAIYWSSRPQHLTNRPRHHRLEASTYSFPAQWSDVKKKRPRLAEGTLFHGHFPHANRQIAINCVVNPACCLLRRSVIQEKHHEITKHHDLLCLSATLSVRKKQNVCYILQMSRHLLKNWLK